MMMFYDEIETNCLFLLVPFLMMYFSGLFPIIVVEA